MKSVRWVVLGLVLGLVLLCAGGFVVRGMARFYFCEQAGKPGQFATSYDPIAQTCTAHVLGTDVRVF